MEPLADVGMLQDRIEWQLDDGEIALAEGVLEDLSDEARLYGSMSWATGETTPRQVINLVLRATIRYMRNPDGYVQSRAGDETVAWSDQRGENESAGFTAKEIKMLERFAGTPAIYSVEISAWNSKIKSDQTGYVPTDIPNEKPFPFFAEDYI